MLCDSLPFFCVLSCSFAAIAHAELGTADRSMAPYLSRQTRRDSEGTRPQSLTAWRSRRSCGSKACSISANGAAPQSSSREQRPAGTKLEAQREWLNRTRLAAHRLSCEEHQPQVEACCDFAMCGEGWMAPFSHHFQWMGPFSVAPFSAPSFLAPFSFRRIAMPGFPRAREGMAERDAAVYREADASGSPRGKGRMNRKEEEAQSGD